MVQGLSELTDTLTDAEIFVLMACEGVGKSNSLRVFSERGLAKPSVLKPLSAKGVALDSVIRSLIEKGFLLRAGRGRLSSTSDGNIVKHECDRLRNEMVLGGKIDPFTQTRLDMVPTLRRELAERARAGHAGLR